MPRPRNSKTPEPQLTAEDKNLLSRLRHWFELLVWLAPAVGLFLTGALFFMVWQPISDISALKDTVGPLSVLPKAIEDSEGRLTDRINGLDAQVSSLQPLSGEVKHLTQDVADAKKLISESTAASTIASQKVVSVVERLDGLKTQTESIQTKLKELETLPQSVKATTEAVAALDRRVKELGGPEAKRTSATVALVLGKTPEVIDSGAYKLVTYTFPLKDLPALGDPEHYRQLAIERTDLHAPGGKTSTVAAVESQLDIENASVTVSIWVPPSDVSALIESLTKREAQLLVTISRPLP